MAGTKPTWIRAIAFFAQLAEQGRLDLGDTSLARLESGEIEVGLFWDFNALNYANQVAETNPNASFEVTIPLDGTIQSGYATVINATAPNPHAAALAREYILSDEGQINLAKGYARPIRDNVELPQEVQDILLPEEQYVKAQPVSDFACMGRGCSRSGSKMARRSTDESKIIEVEYSG